MTLRIAKRSSFRVASRARWGELFNAGTATAARIPMIVMTTRSSKRVNPLWARRRLFISPILVIRSVDRPIGGEREDVVDVLASPGDRVGIVLEAPLSPFGLLRHRIDRDSAQELLLLVDLADQRDAL